MLELCLCSMDFLSHGEGDFCAPAERAAVPSGPSPYQREPTVKPTLKLQISYEQSKHQFHHPGKPHASKVPNTLHPFRPRRKHRDSLPPHGRMLHQHSSRAGATDGRGARAGYALQDAQQLETPRLHHPLLQPTPRLRRRALPQDRPLPEAISIRQAHPLIH